MLRSLGGKMPRIHPQAFVHGSAEVIGDVRLGPEASVWPLCSLRGDIERIVVGRRSNIQDHTAIHTRRGAPTLIGDEVTVGHGAVLHGCRIGDGALIGMGAIVLEATVGKGALVGAGALVPPDMKIPAGSLALGVPAKVVRKLSRGEARAVRQGMLDYLRLAARHRSASRELT
ncbi:MAG: hypothetical protein A2X36_16140 [Elusimicrobia bacterium GWA2_69_24]|nr:MAG: hypothetical protein A2X36_16140 [Elusimicrobia bacterium GWA2_69_24]HBL17155.1 gamma carbonic anhydrase family protein [Elusimicrobiota bacterium]